MKPSELFSYHGHRLKLVVCAACVSERNKQLKHQPTIETPTIGNQQLKQFSRQLRQVLIENAASCAIVQEAPVNLTSDPKACKKHLERCQLFEVYAAFFSFDTTPDVDIYLVVLTISYLLIH